MGGYGGALVLLAALSLISSAASSRSILVVQKSAPLAEDSSNTTGKVSPNLSPPASQLPRNPSEDQAQKSNILDTPTGLDHKSPDVSASTNHPDGKQKVSNKGETKKNEEKDNKAIGNKGTCFANPINCTDQGSLSACIVGFASGDNNLQLLVENTGDADLKVNYNFLLAKVKKEIEVRKHESVKINVSSVPGESNKLVLSAGHGDCTLLVGPLVHPEINYFTYLPTFDKLLTPINGAYLSIFMVAVLAGFFTCWKCRKTQGEVRYQQLEMVSQEEAQGVTNAGSMVGWDEGWDDDWDEENAVKSPAARHTGNISAHGLTSRGANKDGWENDWDD